MFSKLFFWRKKTEKVEITDISLDKHDEYYGKGCKYIEPYMQLHGGKSKKPDKGKIKQGIQYLDAVTKINPQNWAAYWIKGKGYQAIDDNESSYQEFKRSFEIQKNNVDVARELTFASLNLGRSEEAINTAKHALSLQPTNSGLLANLSLAYLVNREPEKAENTAKEAIILDPNDNINKRLLSIIKEVRSGQRPQPEKYSDLI